MTDSVYGGREGVLGIIQTLTLLPVTE
jgi:hypothetical protein